MAAALRNRRLGFVDSLRALAALEVVGAHIREQIEWPKVPHILLLPFDFAHAAVSVFIVLSGFSLMLPVARNGGKLAVGALGFYWRRVRRILPPYYLAIGFSLLLIWLLIGHKTYTHWDNSLPVTWNSVLIHLFLVQDFSSQDRATINHVLWSVAVECQIYVLFPALVLFWRRYHPAFATVIVVILSLLLSVVLAFTPVGGISGYMSAGFAPQYIGLFAMGMFGASAVAWAEKADGKVRGWYLWGVAALICWPTVIAFRGEASVASIAAIDVVTGIATMSTLILGAHHSRFNWLRAALEWSPLVWVGGFSYSLYLVHAPLIQVIWQYGLYPLKFRNLSLYLGMLVVGYLLIVPFAWVFWYFCERPFLNSGKPGKSGQKPRSAAMQEADLMEPTLKRPAIHPQGQ